jgi:hypothetical protein
MVDGRASLDAGRFTLFAYGQNLLDTFQVIGWTGSRDNSFVHVEVTDAREMGVGLQARF